MFCSTTPPTLQIRPQLCLISFILGGMFGCMLLNRLCYCDARIIRSTRSCYSVDEVIIGRGTWTRFRTCDLPIVCDQFSTDFLQRRTQGRLCNTRPVEVPLFLVSVFRTRGPSSDAVVLMFSWQARKETIIQKRLLQFRQGQHVRQIHKLYEQKSSPINTQLEGQKLELKNISSMRIIDNITV